MIMVDSRRRVDQKTSDEQLRRKREETEALLHPFLWLRIIYTLERVQHEKRDETGGGGAGGGGRNPQHFCRKNNSDKRKTMVSD